MTIDNADRVRFDALKDIIVSCSQQGIAPRADLVMMFNQLLIKYPDWIEAPPPSNFVPPPPPPPSDKPRAAIPWRPGERIPVTIDEDMVRIVEEVLDIIGKRYRVFQSGGKLVEVQRDKAAAIKFLVCEPNMPRLVTVGPSRARVIASRECQFVQEKTSRDGTPVATPILPPDWIGGALTTCPEFEKIPPLAAIAQAPTLRRDGALVHEPGYDESTGIYLASDVKVNVPNNPTQTDAKVAMTRLLDLISDFDFTTDASRSVWVAGVLSVAARHTFSGPVPIIIIDASVKGAGKSKLADLASIIATGAKAARMTYNADDVEMNKMITALGMAGEQTVLLDNVVGKLASPSLDAALTSDTYRGRILGKSEMSAAVPMKIVWFATGNGLIMGADTARRTIMARLEPMTDRPEDRTGPRPGTTWKYPDILGYAHDHRAEFLSYALTVVKAFITAGRPSMGLRPMGSFEAWSDTIRSAIVWSGAADPCETISHARAADLQDHAVRMMVECWPVADDVAVTAAALIEWAEVEISLTDPTKRAMFDRERPIREQWRNALLEWLPAKKGDLPTARDLGYALRAVKGSVIGDYRIEAGEPMKSGLPWRRFRVIQSKDTTPAPPPPMMTSPMSLVR